METRALVSSHVSWRLAVSGVANERDVELETPLPESLRDTLSCPVCFNILNRAVRICPIGDVVCQKCDENWRKKKNEKCPCCNNKLERAERDRTARKLVADLQVKCLNSGCKKITGITDLEEHLKRCEYQPQPECKIEQKIVKPVIQTKDIYAGSQPKARGNSRFCEGLRYCEQVFCKRPAKTRSISKVNEQSTRTYTSLDPAITAVKSSIKINEERLIYIAGELLRAGILSHSEAVRASYINEPVEERANAICSTLLDKLKHSNSRVQKILSTIYGGIDPDRRVYIDQLAKEMKVSIRKNDPNLLFEKHLPPPNKSGLPTLVELSNSKPRKTDEVLDQRRAEVVQTFSQCRTVLPMIVHSFIQEGVIPVELCKGKDVSHKPLRVQGGGLHLFLACQVRQTPEKLKDVIKALHRVEEANCTQLALYMAEDIGFDLYSDQDQSE